MKIVAPRFRKPPMRMLVFGPVGSWKTSTLAQVPNLLWIDLHGSTSVLNPAPALAFDPEVADSRPATYSDFRDMLQAICREHKGEFDGVATDGLDDLEQLYLIPEALRRCGAKTLNEDFWAPARMLLQVHKELWGDYERLWQAGFALYFTAHDQNLERVNPDGLNYLVKDIALFYQPGKTGGVNCPAVWRDQMDHVLYLTTEGQAIRRLNEKDKIARAVGDPTKHVAYLRSEGWLDSVKTRRLEELKSPLTVDSPEQLWQTVSETWDRGFCADPEKLRAIASARIEAMIAGGKTKNPDKAREMLAAAQDVPALQALIQKLK